MTLENFPTTRPSFTANFARSQQMPPQVTFSRASQATSPAVPSPGTVTGPNGTFLSDYNTPRFAWKDGKCQGLLIEEARTNNITNSAVFSSGYGVSNVAATDNTATAPDGTTTAASLMETGGAGFHNFYRPEITSGAAGDYAQSIFVKDNGRAYVNLRWLSNSVSNCWHTVTFALIGDGAVTQEQSGSGANFTNISRSIEHIGNGWYRITLGASNPNAQIYPWILDGSDSPTPTLNSLYGVASYTGDTAKGYYIWGGQWEEGLFATSLIPTSGATATRAQDVCTITGTNFSSWYNLSGGTIVSSFYPYNKGKAYTLHNGSTNQRIILDTTDAGTGITNGVANYAAANPGGTAARVGVVDPNTQRTIKNAFRVEANNHGAANNGSLATGSVAAPAPSVTTMQFFTDQTGTTNLMNGYLHNWSYYPTQASNDTLEALTQ